MTWLVFGPVFVVARIAKIAEELLAPRRRRELIRQQTRAEVAAAEWRGPHRTAPWSPTSEGGEFDRL